MSVPAISSRTRTPSAAGSPWWAEGPGGDGRPVLAGAPHQREESFLESRNEGIAVDGQDSVTLDPAAPPKARALERAARLLGRDDQAARLALGSLWDEAFENGRLAALDEFHDRFCVCTK